MSSYRSIVILTGAGISAESGIQTFRAADGLWENHRVEDVATPEGYAADPALVQHFYNERRQYLLNGTVAPNAGHEALARLEREFDGELLLVTQNIDDLHERSGSENLIHMHGELLKMFCSNCRTVEKIEGDISLEQRCHHCDAEGTMRPDIVWFGEMPYEMDRIYSALAQCDLFVAIGTSGQVYPAAGFVQEALRAGAHTIEVNPDASAVNSYFAQHLQGRAGSEVPALVDRLLKAQ